MKRGWIFMGAGIAALFHTVVLGGIIEQRASVLRDGEQVLLKTVPVDPRDLFRGKFVRLNYEISALDPSLFSGFEGLDLSEDRTVFVTLQRDESGHGVPVRVTPFLPEVSEPGMLVLAADGRNFRNLQRTQEGTTRPIRVTYGLEQFFVPEDDALAIEREYRDEDISVSVGVSVVPDGRAQIRELIINGQSRYEEPLY